jgi:hypothetical protein
MPSTAFIAYAEADEAAAHRLHLAFMLHNANARMMQKAIADAAQRQHTLRTTYAGIGAVVVIHSAHSAEDAVWREQIEIGVALGKTLLVCSLDDTPLTALPITALQAAPHIAFNTQAWEAAIPHVWAALDITPQPLADHLPDDDQWLADTWRVKFYNFSTAAHGYGELTLNADHSVSGNLNIAQKALALATAVDATWTLQGAALSVQGTQQLRLLKQALPYQLEVSITQCGERTFSAQTAQGDESVFQRAPR